MYGKLSIPVKADMHMLDKQTSERIAKLYSAARTPVDFDQLVEDKVLMKRGKSYYVLDMERIPPSLNVRINGIEKTEHGMKLILSSHKL